MRNDYPEPDQQLSILMVCLGNICRSPVAEYVLRKKLAARDLDVIVDSCGTGDWHIGHHADKRMIAAAKDAGYDMTAHRARQLSKQDFSRFTHIFVMDKSNREDAFALCPYELQHKVQLFTQAAGLASPVEVPDPFYGDRADFDKVVKLVEKGAEAIVKHLQQA